MKIIIILLVAMNSAFAQNNFGIEVRSSLNTTYNTGEIYGAAYGLGGNVITKEENLTTTSFSIGATYSINDKNTFKLSIGRHKNGQVIDITLYDDYLGPDDEYHGVVSTLYYLQLVPSYAYFFNTGKFRFPIEAGFAINKRIKEIETLFIGINEYNFDLRLSTGLGYNLATNFYLGLNFVYSKALSNYLNTDYMIGEYYPNQFGMEVCAQYIFERKNRSL